LDQTERAGHDESADGFANGAAADADAASDPRDRAVEMEFAFEAGVAEEIGIDGAVGDGEAELGEKDVLELFPKTGGV
jgi:hypothetical protein